MENSYKYYIIHRYCIGSAVVKGYTLLIEYKGVLYEIINISEENPFRGHKKKSSKCCIGSFFKSKYKCNVVNLTTLDVIKGIQNNGCNKIVKTGIISSKTIRKLDPRIDRLLCYYKKLML